METQTKNWREVKLSEVAYINPDSVGKNFPFEQILYTDISSVGSGIAETPTEMSFSEAPSRARRLVKNGDTILSTVRPNRRSFLYVKNPEENRVVSTGFAVLRAGTKIDPRFLYYLISNQSFTDYLTLHAKGAAYPAVDEEIIANARIIIPEFDKQKDIGSILSTYDDLIENNTMRIKILEEIAQAIYKEWFVSSVNGSKLPKGWKILQVESLVKRVSPGKLYDNKTAQKTGKVPILDQGKSGIIGYHNDPSGVEASIENPIIVFANHTCYQRLILFPFSAIQNVLPFYPSEENYRNIFWLHYATKDLIEFNDYKGHWPEFMQKEVIVPPPEITERFGNEVKPLIVLAYQLELINKDLRQARDLLLPKLVAGEIKIL